MIRGAIGEDALLLQEPSIHGVIDAGRAEEQSLAGVAGEDLLPGGALVAGAVGPGAGGAVGDQVSERVVLAGGRERAGNVLLALSGLYLTG